MFLHQLRMDSAHWAGLPGKTVKERLDGLCFTILSLFDGCVPDLPAWHKRKPL